MAKCAKSNSRVAPTVSRRRLSSPAASPRPKAAKILRRQKAVDLVVGPQNYHRLPDLLRRAETAPVIDTEFPVEDKFDFLVKAPRRITQARGVTAFVTVQEGCDKFCTFCVVPYTRGTEVSRPVEKIVAEIEDLADAGVREITLLGQNVNAYHGEGPDGRTWSLAKLCARLAEVPGIARLRYTTSHPNDMDDDLIAAHRDLPALMPFLHLPVQSGSDTILTAMNRKHNRESYREIVRRLRAARPDIALSVGFHRRLSRRKRRRFCRDARSHSRDRLCQHVLLQIFAASRHARRRHGCASSGRREGARLIELQDLVETQRRAFNQSLVGRTLAVLFEKTGRHAGQIAGRSPYLQPVQVDASDTMIGRVAPVEITGVGPNSLFGRLILGRQRGFETI